MNDVTIYAIMIGGWVLLALMLASERGPVTGRRWAGAFTVATAWFSLCLVVLR